MTSRSLREPKNVRILYIEDNRENRMLVRAILEAEGYTIVDAEDGLSGIEAAIREQPDLILLDINLPGVDGYEVASILKSFSSIATTPVIALTAYAMEGDRQRTLVAGCDGYIQKPIDVDGFPNQVAEFLRGKRERVEEREEHVYLRELNQRLVYRLVNQVEELKRLNQHFVRRAGQLAELHRAVQDITSEVGVAELLEKLLPEVSRALGTLQLTVELDEPAVRVEVSGDTAERPRSVLSGAVDSVEDWVEVEWSLPLIARGHKLGTMTARHVLPPGAKADEEQLLNIVANQVAIAVENSRLYDRVTHRAVEQEGLVAAGRLLTGTLQVSEVLGRLAELIRTRIGGVVRIWLRDGTTGELSLSAQAGATATPGDGPNAPARALARWVLEKRAPLVVSQLASDPRMERRDWIEREGFVGFLGVPLVLEDTPVGILSVLSRDPRPFRADEVAFAEALATSAAAAIRNARSYEATQHQLRNTETLVAVSQAIGSTLDLTEVLRRTARAMARAVGADTAGAWLLSPDENTFLPLVGYHVPKDVVDEFSRTPITSDHALFDYARKIEGPVFTHDSQADRHFDHPLARMIGHKSILIQPMWLKGENIGGFALVWMRDRHEISADDLRLVDGIARQAAVAVDNARLLDAEREARAELLTSETRYRELFENALDMVYLHDVDGRILAVNQAAVDASGYARGELERMTIGELVVPEGLRGGAAELTQRMLAGDQRAGLVAAELITKDGRRRPLEVSARLIEKNGEAVAVQGIARDISVRRSLEARQKAFVEIVERLAAEDDFERIFGLIGRSVCELTAADTAVISLVEGDDVVLRGWYGYQRPDDATPRRRVADSRVGRVVRERRPFGSTDMREDPQWRDSVLVTMGFRAILDVPIMLRGEVIGVLGILSTRARSFSEEEVALLLSLAGHAAVAIDRTNLLSALKDRLAESQTLLNVTQAVSSTLDLSEMMRRVSKAAASALGADMVGAYLADADQRFLRPIAGYRVPAHLRESVPILLRGHRFVEEAWVSHQPVASMDSRNDARIDASALDRFPNQSLVFIPMIVKGEAIGGLFALWWDRVYVPRGQDLKLVEGIAGQAAVAIENSRLYEGVKRQMTELRQTQAQLIQSTKLAAIGELAANIAHEINNPLTTVLGFASFLAEKLEPGAATLEELTLIQEEATRARDIVRDLLQFSRQSDFLPAMTDINLVVEQVLSMVRRQGAVEMIDVQEQYGADLPLVEIDVSRIKQVFLNVINNAIYAMPDGGALTVRTRAGDGHIDVQFSDTGTGIDPDNVARIFDPFFTTKPDVSGTGLGLSVSLGIVQSHGGTIEVDSTLGKGSTFTVKLPVSS